MEDNEGVRFLPNWVFGDVTFEDIFIYNTSLFSVHPGALLPSKDRLWYLRIELSRLEEFPWDVLPEFISLTNLNLDVNELKNVPPLQSPTLESLYIRQNRISKIAPGWSLPSLKELSLREW